MGRYRHQRVSLITFRRLSWFQAEAAEGESWDSSALHFTQQRYPREEYCHMVKRTLIGMQEKAAQATADEDRLARLYDQVELTT